MRAACARALHPLARRGLQAPKRNDFEAAPTWRPHGSRGLRAVASAAAEDSPPRQPVCVYVSSDDMAGASAEARRKCQFAAALGAMGFTGVLISAAQTAPLPMLAIFVAGAAANTYMIMTVSSRMLWTLAARNVEKLSILQPAAGTEDASSPMDADAFASAKEVHLRIESTNVVRQLRLEEPAAAWEGARFAGLVAETRVPFRELCLPGSVLHIVPDGGDCGEHRKLLDALLASEKVVADELVEVREDVAEDLRPLAKYMHMAIPRIENMRPGEVSSSLGAALGGEDSPAQASARLAQRSTMGGAMLLVTGLLFIGKEANDFGKRKEDAAKS